MENLLLFAVFFFVVSILLLSVAFFFNRQHSSYVNSLLIVSTGFFICRQRTAHGIGNDVINWIEKWLTHRKQRVIVDGEISIWKSVLSGIPQGSILDPILFLIYIYK